MAQRTKKSHVVFDAYAGLETKICKLLLYNRLTSNFSNLIVTPHFLWAGIHA